MSYGRLKNLERSAFHSHMCRHPYTVLPPNNPALYMAAVAGNLLNAAFPITPTMTSVRGCGGAGALNIRVTTATTFTAAKNITFELKGRDENWEDFTELVTCVGNAAATQNFPSKFLYSSLDRIRVLSSSENLVAGEVFTVGIGDGIDPPAVGTMRIPNPVAGAPLGSFLICPHSVVPADATALNAVAISTDGKQLTLTTNYGTSGAARIALILPKAFNDSVLENA